MHQKNKCNPWNKRSGWRVQHVKFRPPLLSLELTSSMRNSMDLFLVLILRPKLITQTSCVAKSLVSHQWNPSKTNCNNNMPPSESLFLSPYHCLPGKGIWKDRITASNVAVKQMGCISIFVPVSIGVTLQNSGRKGSANTKSYYLNTFKAVMYRLRFPHIV